MARRAFSYFSGLPSSALQRLGRDIGFFVVVVFWGVLAQGQGLLLPEGSTGPGMRLPRPHFPHHPPVIDPRPMQLYRIAELDIQSTLKDGVAQVTLNQTFENQGSSVSEVSAIFPLTQDGAVSSMTFLVDGQEIGGKLLAVDEARSIYESYVRRSKDPALVQWIGQGMMRTNVFPIPPGAKRVVTLTYSQLINRVDGQWDWKLPLTTAGYTSEPIQKFKLSVRVVSESALGNIYSPSHDVVTKRNGEREAYLTFESQQYVPSVNFRVLCDDRSSEVAARVSSYRPTPGEDGYFLMLLNPEFKDALKNDSAKNIVLVLDKSGSMRGEKMEQARKSLLYVLDQLRPEDHFGLIVYDSQVQAYRDALQPVNAENRDAAKAFVQQLEASGGTNIDQALESAFRLVSSSTLPTYVVFLTDGAPTVGERDPRQITARATGWNKNRARLLNFGVGFDVNSQLLDRLSRACYGQTFLVEPKEDIEEAVSRLYTRIGQTALSNVRWTLKNSNGELLDITKMVYPNPIQDLFSGDQVTLLGRFTRATEATLIVEGDLGTNRRRYEYAVKLEDNSSGDRAFIASLWAMRRAGAIIDEIDLEGDKQELVKELVELSKRYGILTPYTAFLAEEPGTMSRPALAEQRTTESLHRLRSEAGADAFRQRGLKNSQSIASNLDQLKMNQDRAASALGGSAAPAMAGLGQAGGGGRGAGLPPAPSTAPKDASQGLATGPSGNRVKQSVDRAFFHREGNWVDSTISEEQLTKKQVVERFSQQYFDLVAKNQSLLEPLLDSDDSVIVLIDGVVYQL